MMFPGARSCLNPFLACCVSRPDQALSSYYIDVLASRLRPHRCVGPAHGGVEFLEGALQGSRSSRLSGSRRINAISQIKECRHNVYEIEVKKVGLGVLCAADARQSDKKFWLFNPPCCLIRRVPQVAATGLQTQVPKQFCSASPREYKTNQVV